MSSLAQENVVARLRRRTNEARQMGFDVRTVMLDGAEPSWCQIGQRRVILLDLAQAAAEQLQHLEEILASSELSVAEVAETSDPASSPLRSGSREDFRPRCGCVPETL